MSDIFVLTLNCGSSSLKFSIINPKTDNIEILGIANFLCSSKVEISWKNRIKKHKYILYSDKDIEEIIHFIFHNILQNNLYIFDNISCIGHRIVHGGLKLRKSVIINKETMKYIKDASIFAPLHNPINLLGIKSSFKIFPHLKKKM